MALRRHPSKYGLKHPSKVTSAEPRAPAEPSGPSSEPLTVGNDYAGGLVLSAPVPTPVHWGRTAIFAIASEDRIGGAAG